MSECRGCVVAVLVAVGAGCSPGTSSSSSSSGSSNTPGSIATAPPRLDASAPFDAAVDAPCAVAAPTKIENGTCERNEDCVLTDLPEACDACNLEEAYPALRTAFDRRVARCTTPSCATSCPPHDNYIPAFYRAECRQHRCIAWRYHGGG